MALLFTLVMFAIVLVSRMCGVYVAGSVFDSMMDTNITPIVTVGMLIFGGGGSYASGTDDANGIGKLIAMVIILPFAALFGALIADMLFPLTTQAFMDMISYEGSIYGLALWGSLAMAVIKSIIGLIVLVAVLPLVAIFSD